MRMRVSARMRHGCGSSHLLCSKALLSLTCAFGALCLPLLLLPPRAQFLRLQHLCVNSDLYIAGSAAQRRDLKAARLCRALLRPRDILRYRRRRHFFSAAHAIVKDGKCYRDSNDNEVLHILRLTLRAVSDVSRPSCPQS